MQQQPLQQLPRKTTPTSHRLSWCTITSPCPPCIEYCLVPNKHERTLRKACAYRPLNVPRKTRRRFINRTEPINAPPSSPAVGVVVHRQQAPPPPLSRPSPDSRRLATTTRTSTTTTASSSTIAKTSGGGAKRKRSAAFEDANATKRKKQPVTKRPKKTSRPQPAHRASIAAVNTQPSPVVVAVARPPRTDEEEEEEEPQYMADVGKPSTTRPSATTKKKQATSSPARAKVVASRAPPTPAPVCRVPQRSRSSYLIGDAAPQAAPKPSNVMRVNKEKEKEKEKEEEEEERPVMTTETRMNHLLHMVLNCIDETIRKPIEKEYKHPWNWTLKTGGSDRPLSHDDKEWLQKVEPLLRPIVKCCQNKRHRIGFFGTRGAGKSSVIGAIMRATNLLPVDHFGTCTAAICEISGWTKKSYQVVIEFITQTEWADKKQRIIRYLQAKASNEEDLDKEDEELADALCPDGNLQALEKHERDIHTYQQYNSANASELSQVIERYTKFSSNMWPLVSRVVIDGPFPELLDITLVDIPGISDGYATTEKCARKVIESCHAVFYMTTCELLKTPVTLHSLNYITRLMVPRVGILLTRLDAFKRNQNPRITDAQSQEFMRMSIAEGLKGGKKFPPDVSAYFVEAKSDAPSLLSFVNAEITTKGVQAAKCKIALLYNVVDMQCRLLRKAVLSPCSDSERNVMHAAIEKLAPPQHLVPPEDVIRTLTDMYIPETSVNILARLESLNGWKQFKAHVRHGRIELGDFAPVPFKNITLSQLRLSIPNLSAILPSLSDEQLQQYQMKLDEDLAEFLKEIKSDLQNMVQATQQSLIQSVLAPTVCEYKGTGATKRALEFISSKLPELLVTHQRQLHATIVAWYGDSCLARFNDNIRKPILDTLVSLLSTELVSPERRAFFEAMLGPSSERTRMLSLGDEAYDAAVQRIVMDIKARIN